MKERISDSAPLLPPKTATSVLPDVVTSLLLGANVIKKYKGGDGVFVGWNDVSTIQDSWHLAAQDYETADLAANELRKELGVCSMMNGREMLRVRRHADRKIREGMSDENVKSVAMLKDKGSSGWWRMVLPARAMKVEGWNFDCTAAPVNFDDLLEYDTIFVQRIHDWESFYMLERLHNLGKRIVYDIDDDLFNITQDNPAYHTITRDDQLAAAHCMKMADVVTVTTQELKRRLTGVLEGVEPVVIPNAWDINDNWSDEFGSPDGLKRILWSGGASHAADWEECFAAVSDVMIERSNVRLMILGYLPPCIESVVSSPQFKGRIEFCGFRDPQTYYEMIHHVRADVGLAPVRATDFNAAKSSIKYLEYSLMGIPTVASDWEPYRPVITDKKNGRLVSGTNEWKEAIEYLLDRPNKGKEMVRKARKNCEQFDLNLVAEQWKEVLCHE